MNSEVYIKSNLISRIKNSKDLNLLKAIQTILDSTDENLFRLTHEQEKSIERGKNDLVNDKVTSHEVVMNETEEWLKNL